MRGRVTVPSSKSLTNRYLLLAALADAPSTVISPLDSRDSRLMLEALQALGAGIEHICDYASTGEPAVRITPLATAAPLQGQGSPPAVPERQPASEPPSEVDCGLAGTVMRFLPAVAALTGRTVRFDGDPEARVRPMGAVLQGLRDLGADIEEHPSSASSSSASSSSGAGGSATGTSPTTLPFVVHAPGGLRGGEVALDASGSSQFVSGLLLAAPLMPEGLTVRHTGDEVPSSEHVSMTVEVLRELGVVVDDSQPFRWHVSPGRPRAFTVRVEPDLSNAGPFLVAAALTGGEVSVPGWPLRSTQIGRRWTEILTQFGAEVDLTEEPDADVGGTATLTVRGRLDAESRPVVTSPGTVDGTAELTPTVAALAALAQGPTTFTAVGHLRGHETDRLAALVTELRRLGADAEETDDGFRVLSPVTRGAVVRSYADHRMATFGAAVGLRLDSVSVEDIGCTAKTMPTFPSLWRALVSPDGRTAA